MRAGRTLLRLLCVALACCTLAGCGQMGALSLPEAAGNTGTESADDDSDNDEDGRENER